MKEDFVSNGDRKTELLICTLWWKVTFYIQHSFVVIELQSITLLCHLDKFKKKKSKSKIHQFTVLFWLWKMEVL